MDCREATTEAHLALLGELLQGISAGLQPL